VKCVFVVCPVPVERHRWLVGLPSMCFSAKQHNLLVEFSKSISAASVCSSLAVELPGGAILGGIARGLHATEGCGGTGYSGVKGRTV
jgi:hypothetical protein